jgi:hypothetical protein
MTTPFISRLQRVLITDIWSSESQEFTPWLASSDNLQLLGDAIGLRLELQSTEKSVGDFRADIVCKSLPDEGLVLIENQYNQTDHRHLGQILTYTAGLEAVTIVWIAERFRDEHRAVIDWLNEKTPENINFFGLEIELWRIADSPVAPKFNIVCKPNEWTRNTIAATRPPTELGEFRWNYWSGFVQQPSLAAIVSGEISPNRQGNLPIPTGWQNFLLQVYILSNGGAGIYISCRGADRFFNFEKLQEQQDAVEHAVGSPLSWDCKPNLNRAWILLAISEIDARERDQWQRQHQQLAEKTVAFYQALDPFIRALNQPET